MKFFRIKTPNARLLFLKSVGFSADWTKLLAELSQFMAMNSKLSYANLSTYLYFFESPLDDSFLHSGTWVAKEIVGLPQLGEGSDVETTDLDQGEIYRFNLNSTLEGELGQCYFYPEGIKQLYREAQKLLKADSCHPATTWRIVVKEEVLEGKLKIELFMDFFSEDT
ncbi:MAG: hypothetical protein ACOYL6_07330 [Bacteriovoracaceae bacterium]